MQALVYDGAAARVRDVPEPTPGGWAGREQLAIVRVRLAGVCNTDLELARGYMGFRGVLGHEFVGVVEAGPTEWLGARVVGEINFACGHCRECGRGLPRHCSERRVMGILNADGAMAERVAVPVANLHRVPDPVTDEEAVFTEPLAAAFEILEQVRVARDERCLVLGDGKLGLLVAQALREGGARPRVLGRHPAKLAVLEALGIETARADDWRGEACDLVVEATGSPRGFARAVALTRPRGRLVLKSTVAEHPDLDLAPVVVNEIQVVGSRCGPFSPALAALAAGRIETAALVHDRLPLHRADEALERAARPGVLKVLVDCA